MSYGLYVEGGNEILQIDSSKNYLEGYAVLQTGTASSFSQVGPSDIFFFNFVPAPGSAQVVLVYYGGKEGFPAVPPGGFITMGRAYAASAYSQINVNYVHLRRSKDIDTSTYGTYGLQVFNELGDTIVFDSRAVQRGFTVTQYFPTNSLGSNSTDVSSIISTNINTYGTHFHSFYKGFPTAFWSGSGIIFGTSTYIEKGYVFAKNHASLYTGVYSYSRGYNESTDDTWGQNFAPIILGETF